MSKRKLLEMDHIKKSFPGVKALDDVTFEMEKGEVHALMGENGAGKSTLIKILTGVYGKDEGTVVFDGEEVNFQSALDAQLNGISTIYQEISLSPFLSVTENIFMGREPKKRWGSIDWKRAHQESEAILKDMGIEVDVRTPVSELSAAVQQMVSIARAISMKAKLVVMDEPTSSLNDQEVQILFKVIRKLKSEGVSILYISHRLDEIYSVCDRISVLRDGHYIGTWLVQELNQIQLISHMIGRTEEEVEKLSKQKAANISDDEEVIVELKGISQGNKVKSVDLHIRKGEVLGLAGLLGSGRTETAQVIFGVHGADKGQVLFMGEEKHLKAPYDAVKLGIGYCSEERKSEGIIPNMSVKENLTISMLPKISKWGILSRKTQNEIVERYIRNMGIKTPNANQKIKNLSGGNQQKVLLARWLATNPKLLILDEPTRGIDVGAKAEIHSLIADMAKEGLSILMISSEFEELVHHTDRIAVIRDGEKVGELTGEDRNEKQIMQMIASSSRIESEQKGTVVS
ncbi:MAG TPA: sugar ABC transporter ATP-binding protein [Bacillales bacterium]|nr:sugar ABC transporter ATP-binding protein [Bacillales bacterium]